ncbi:MAG: hypothetical protein IE931_04645 [Sphingobacteriales bacterium]|nr:hypothetical protein [Sphingobacteriales bacterium]
MRLFTVLFLFLLFSKISIAQQNYANEWIKSSNTYYKIQIAQKGIFKLDYNTLNAAGLDLNNINPQKIKIFKNGQEQAIYVNGEADLKFNPSDFILFYADKNDGQTDLPLYSNPNFDPNPYVNLYNDTASYFLTIDTDNGKRLTLTQTNTSALTPQSSINVDVIQSFSNNYYRGAYIIESTSESEYTEGEGLAGNAYGLGQSQIFTLNTPNYINSTPIQISYSLIGRSNASSTNSKGLNHHFRLEISTNNSSYTSFADSSFKAYSLIKGGTSLNGLNLSGSTYIKYSIVNDLNAVTDYQAPAYFRLNYQRNLDINGLKSLEFSSDINSKSLFRFINSSLNDPYLISENGNQIVKGLKNGNSVDLEVNPDQQNKFYLFDAALATSVTLQKVSFKNVPQNLANDFIIITNQKLIPSALNYANYRNQTGYKSYLITTDELFNEFYYGLNHPLAIRNFVQYLQDKSPSVKYILLLGKGIENQYLKSADGQKLNLVPSIGTPPSDNMYSAPLYGTNLAPKLAISRIAANNNDEVEIYLNKLKAYENKPNGIERKEIIHISGGTSLSDNLSWSNYQSTFGKYATSDFFGANIFSFKKNVTEPITNNLQEKIITEINKGSTFLSFFGHGSTFATEINFGEPNELADNTLLFYMVNGCLAGDANTTSTSIGEASLFQPNKAGVGWIATSDEGVASYLASFSNLFYKNIFKDHYGESVAENMKYSIQQYQNPNDILNRMHSRQYNFQGDPAIKFYSPSKPDYYFDSNAFFIANKQPTTALDSLKIGIIVKNSGKALTDSLSISVERTLTNNTKINYPVKLFKPVFNTDTLYLTIASEGAIAQGNNTFKITADAKQTIDESNELNNSLTTTYYLPGNGINILFPKLNAIVDSNKINLEVQASDLFTSNKTYFFEIDTVADFSSAWKKTSSVTANAIAKSTFDILTTNNITYYWRAKIDLPENQGGIWQYSNFSYQNHIKEGFFQKDRNLTYNNLFKNIIYNSDTKKFDYTKTTHTISLETRGDAASTTTERTFRSSVVGRLAFASYEFTGFTLIAMDPIKTDFFSFPSVNNFQNYPPVYTGQYFFNVNSAVGVDSLVNYINRIPDGYYVVGFNGRNVDLKGMNQRAKDAFAKLGCLIINHVNAGEPYLFFGQKGFAPGQATEMIADPNSSIPTNQQDIKMSKEYNPFWDRGYYLSQKIGPATQWNTAYLDFYKEYGDSVNYDIIGVNMNGNEQTLIGHQYKDSTNLSQIDAKLFPFLKIKANTTDTLKRTPPQLNSWKVSYQDYPENTVNLDFANNFYKDQIQEGDSVKWTPGYQNISNYPSDSTAVYAVLTNSQRSETKTLIKKLAPLNPNQQVKINYQISSLGLSNKNTLAIEFENNKGLDSYSFNNRIKRDFTVSKDCQQPLVNVTFDGKSIINQEIVSPSPKIAISLTDENKFILLKDTSLIDVYIKKESNNDFKRLNYSTNQLLFTPAVDLSQNSATVNYNPIHLEDGIYTLKVRGKDQSGNYNSANDYEISFEVINESSITNFYPYPNPVVNNMRFVFTITGQKVPDKIKIQILTQSGKIVREILKYELGSIQIGNNISAFSWDGTDQFGDRLANGVYFYKVFIEDTESFKNRQTTNSNQFFKNQTGKIYLLR